ncbi:MAG: nicotinate (nicotinamide) nucleotide adenylyltransferase [Flavisolibacter sp.]
MHIGLYFGSFNPIHNGHLIIANHILNNYNLEKIWFVVSPQNPLKPAGALLNEYDRIHLVKKAIEKDNRLRACDIEFNLPRPSYTAHTLSYLREKYPGKQFSLIMGSDGFQNLGKWKNADFIISNYEIIIYMRPGFPLDNTFHAKIKVMEAPLLEISATYIRELSQAGQSIKYLVPDSVEEEITAYGYFKKTYKK